MRLTKERLDEIELRWRGPDRGNGRGRGWTSDEIGLLVDTVKELQAELANLKATPTAEPK